MGAKYKVRLDRLLAVDLELTCWDGAPPPGEVPEVIQIAYSEIDMQTLTRVRRGMWYIRNELSSVSPYCTALTGIKQTTLDKHGVPLGECGRLMVKNLGSLNKAWIAWGSDMAAVIRDCESKSVPQFLSNAFFNVGLTYSMVNAESRSIGLAEAASRYGIEFEGRQHDALADAEVLADVWMRMAASMRLPPPSPDADVVNQPGFTPGF